MVLFGSDPLLYTDTLMNLRTLRKLFTKSPHTHRPMALWMWNGTASADELSAQAEQLLGGGMGGAMIVPEPTRSANAMDYMNDAWYDALLAVAKRARKNRDSIWIYDDWSDTPSPALTQFLHESPQHCFTSLVLREALLDDTTIGQLTENPPLAVFTKDHPQHTYYDTYKHVSLPEDMTKLAGEVAYIFELKTHAEKLNVFNEKAFASYMETTHAPCQQHIKKYYGNTVGILLISGARYICAPGELPWDTELSSYFKETYGYSLITHLPDLFFETEGASRIRYDFWTFIQALFQEGLVRPSEAWGEEHGIPISGYFGPSNLEHRSQGPLGSAMAFHAHRQFPSLRLNNESLDCLAQLTPDCAHQIVAIKEAVSVVRQLDKSGVINEYLPVDATSPDMSRLHAQIQVQIALGVKFYAYYATPANLKTALRSGITTIMGPQESRWPLCKKYFDSVSRVAWLLSLGKPLCNVLLLHPGDSYHALHQHPTQDQNETTENINPKDTLERHFALLSAALLKNQIDYDYGDEELIGRYGSTTHRAMHIGAQIYTTVILPPSLTMRSSTLHLLQDFAMGGGKLFVVGSAPRLLDGKPSKELQGFIEQYAIRIIDGVDYFNYDQVLEAVRQNSTDTPLMLADDGRQISNLMMQHRSSEDLEILHVVHTGPSEFSAKLNWTPLRDGHVELWDPHTGTMEPIRNCLTGQRMELAVDWEPNQSRTYLVLPGEIKAPAVTPIYEEERRIELDCIGTRTAPNIFPLTTCKIGDSPWMSIEQARQHIQERLDLSHESTKITVHWGLECNPDAPPAGMLYAILDQCEGRVVSWNGEAIEPQAEPWSTDDSYFRYALNSVAGNDCTLSTEMTLSDIRDFQPAYIEGEFAVVPGNLQPWQLRSTSETLTCIPWSEAGMPFYPRNVIYKTETAGYDRFGKGKAVLALPGLNGCAAIRINGATVDHILYPPYECDISDHWKNGPLEIEIDVCGTLTNLISAEEIQTCVGLTAPPAIILLMEQ